MSSSTFVSDLLSTQIQSYIHIQNAIVQCEPDIQDIVHEMIEIIESDDATAEEKRAALYTIQDALFPELIEELVEAARQSRKEPEVIAANRELDLQEATFAHRLQLAMAQSGMTQETLARKTGVSQSAISLMLSRQSRPQMRTIHKFAEALGISPEQLWPL